MTAKWALGAAGLAAATLTTVLPTQAASAATVTTSRPITCAVRSANTWNGCANDNADVAVGKRVYLALTASAGRLVQFRIKNHLTGKVISTPLLKFSPDGVAHVVWTNTTSSAVTIDVEARTAGVTTVRAQLLV
jgi:hypothetical protein